MADAIPRDVDKEEFLVVTFPPDEAYVRKTFATKGAALNYASKQAWNPLLLRRTTVITHELLPMEA